MGAKKNDRANEIRKLEFKQWKKPGIEKIEAKDIQDHWVEREPR